MCNMLGTAREVRTNPSTMFYVRLHRDTPVLTEQQKLTSIYSVQTLNATLRTCQEQWLLRTNGQRESKESVVSACFDYIYIYIYIYIYTHTNYSNKNNVSLYTLTKNNLEKFQVKSTQCGLNSLYGSNILFCKLTNH